MEKKFFEGNRNRCYEQMKKHSLLVLFSGSEVRKTNDEYYPFIQTVISFILRDWTARSLFFWPERTGKGALRKSFTYFRRIL